MQKFFKSLLTDSLKNDMIKKKIWSRECPVSMERLNLLTVSYVDFEKKEHNNGNIMVLDVVADNVLEIFKVLFEYKFPINSLKLINDYNGNDDKSMEANNSSAFNFRKILSTNDVSIHSYGLAIDINPLQNPYLINNYTPKKTNVAVYPPQGMEYINRINIRKGMVESNLNNKLNVVSLFKQNGFSIWGGEWNEPIDLHHFQTTRQQAENLAKLSYEEGIIYFHQKICV